MTDKERLRRIAYDAFSFLLILASLCFICRIWPILLLVILGILIAALRLLFTASRQVPKEDPVSEIVPVPSEEPDRQALLFSAIRNDISALVRTAYPGSAWVWECPAPMQRILSGELIFILLDRVGGFRRVRVILSPLGVERLEVQPAALPAGRADSPQPSASESAISQPDSPQSAVHQPDVTAQPNISQESTKTDDTLIAFEWVESQLLEINNRCNEAIGKGESFVLIQASELPPQESWESICQELSRNDITDVRSQSDGIRINLMY